MYDDMRYDLDSFDFFVGDTVTFEVSNEGEARHEFFIGDIAAHDDHATEMREGGHSEGAHSNPAAVSVAPGATRTLTYTFSEAGDSWVVAMSRATTRPAWSRRPRFTRKAMNPWRSSGCSPHARRTGRAASLGPPTSWPRTASVRSALSAPTRIRHELTDRVQLVAELVTHLFRSRPS